MDYREIPVVAVTTQVPDTHWGLLIKMDQQEMFQPYHALVKTLINLLVIVALAGVVTAYLLANRITRPLVYLMDIANEIRKWGYSIRTNLSVIDADLETFNLSQSLLSMTDQLIQVFDNSPSGMLITDSNGVILKHNPALEKIFGYEAGELIGQKVEVLVPEARRAAHRHHRDRYIKVGMPRRMGMDYQLFGRSKEGEHIPVEIGLAPIITAESETQILASVVDISDRINRLKQEEVQKEKDNFLATMSHELRTPLAAILGHCDVAIDETENQRLLESLKAIKVSGENQLALVNDILDMSKIESGKFSVNELPYDLNALLEQLEGMLTVRAEDAGLKLIFGKMEPLPHKLMGDEQRIQQILVNLIGNAIKFTNTGRVTVTTQVIGERLIFTVEDTGIGMSPEMMDRLFTRFEQADGSISRRFGGSGLGLFISLNLAELMGGTIDASSKAGRGSIFQLILPYRPSEMAIDPLEEKPAVTTSETRLNGLVLVAEDTPALQLLEKRILEGMGLDVLLAGNGVEAIELARQHPIDLILMDMQMPEMDGIEACSQIRQSGNNTPIIALTANVMQKHREQFTKAGCNAFIGKPIDKEKLRDVLEKHLHQ